MILKKREPELCNLDGRAASDAEICAQLRSQRPLTLRVPDRLDCFGRRDAAVGAAERKLGVCVSHEGASVGAATEEAEGVRGHRARAPTKHEPTPHGRRREDAAGDAQNNHAKKKGLSNTGGKI